MAGDRAMLAGMIRDQKGKCENEIGGDPKKAPRPAATSCAA
jgi:hypothetical protein